MAVASLAECLAGTNTCTRIQIYYTFIRIRVYFVLRMALVMGHKYLFYGYFLVFSCRRHFANLTIVVLRDTCSWFMVLNYMVHGFELLIVQFPYRFPLLFWTLQLPG